MVDARGSRESARRRAGRVPADLAGVLAFVTVGLVAVFAPGISETPLRIVVGLPFTLFLPGYALVSALFPEAGESPAGPEGGSSDPVESDGRHGIDGIERVALSFGLSIAVVPLVGLVLNYTPWGIRLVPVALSIAGLTVLATAVAVRRRLTLPPGERFVVPYRRWLTTAREELFAPRTRVDAALNVLLVLSVLVAMGSVGYAVGVADEDERFTEFYVLNEAENGTLVADDYPTEFRRGQRESLVVGIDNEEHETVDYTVVVALQRVEIARVENGTPRYDVVEETELGRLHPTVAHNETWLQSVDVRPTMTGERLRLTFLLYRSGAPADPTVENAYRRLHLLVNVSATDR